MLDPILSFAISIAMLVGLLAMKYEIHVTLMASAIVFGLLTLGQGILESTVDGVLTYSTISLLIAFFSALLLSYMMNLAGILDKMTRLFASLSCNFASLFVPSLVGLIPMPGGALVSAMMLKEHYLERQRLDKNLASFLNYWFRHIWVPVWPLYQALIFSAVILNTNVVRVIESTFPAFIGSTVAGLLIAYPLLRRRSLSCVERVSSRRDFLISGWPFLLVIILVFLVKLPIEFSLLITALATTVYARPSRKELIEGVKFALSPKIIVVIVAVMMYRQYVLDSHSANALLQFMVSRNIPVMPVVFTLPFVIGATTAAEFVFTGITFPLLIDVLGTGSSINDLALLLGYTGGYIGVMLSPAHLCLVLTLEHYGGRYLEVYKYIVPASMISVLISLALGMILW